MGAAADDFLYKKLTKGNIFSFLQKIMFQKLGFCSFLHSQAPQKPTVREPSGVWGV